MLFYKTTKKVSIFSGVGLDCFRTWEAVAAGAIPIVPNSSTLWPVYKVLSVMFDAIVFFHEWNPIDTSKTHHPLKIHCISQSKLY